MKLLKFSADWCDPCKQLQAHLERILPEEFPHIELVDMNITDDPDVGKIWGVRSIPTLIVLDEMGETSRILIGYNPSKLKGFLAGT